MRRALLSCGAPIALALSLCVAINSPANAETLLCVQEVAGGLKFLDGSWRGIQFSNPGGSQYAITSTAQEPNKYVVKELGKSFEMFTCERYKLASGQAISRLYCGGPAWGMVIDLEKLRYVEIYSHGYIEDDQSGKNTPLVGGGKCSVIHP
ncbi:MULTISPECIES: hypothetical protein [Rhizobium]|uniref:hypothetical protein n=1 Tax=Rhizobium TaxID=379 RepID=UPI0007E4C0F6|nr:hypothetical protein [Rhizobium sp. WYCCWR10014]OAV50942.1 hypothetical protein A6U98_07915 [Rhizobium sp. WYCCWR10014]